MRRITSHNAIVSYNPGAFFSEYGGQRGETRSWWWESTNEKRPGFNPGRLLFAHRKEVVAMKQLRLNVAITIDYRFVLAVRLALFA